jgi:DNA polymerase III sliding clamp (beta) subunit (PCNA family)
MSFHIKTQEGYVIKVLSELLHNNIKVGCFEITKAGMFFRMTDTHNRLCIDITLHAENFEVFQVSLPPNETKILVGINLTHLRKMLRPVKKKETIEFIKAAPDSEDLRIRISSKEMNGETTTSNIKIQEMQIIDIDIPVGYEDYISIPTSKYQKMCKDMETISQKIKIESNKGMITFTSVMEGVYSRSIMFGNQNEHEITYCQHFDSEQLNNLGRISGLGATTSSNIQVFTKQQLPILLKTNVGTLGKIGIYIKSKEQLEDDSY